MSSAAALIGALRVNIKGHTLRGSNSATFILTSLLNGDQLFFPPQGANTVKPVLRGHPREARKLATWLLKAGDPIIEVTT